MKVYSLGVEFCKLGPMDSHTQLAQSHKVSPTYGCYSHPYNSLPSFSLYQPHMHSAGVGAHTDVTRLGKRTLMDLKKKKKMLSSRTPTARQRDPQSTTPCRQLDVATSRGGFSCMSARNWVTHLSWRSSVTFQPGRLEGGGASKDNRRERISLVWSDPKDSSKEMRQVDGKEGTSRKLAFPIMRSIREGLSDPLHHVITPSGTRENSVSASIQSSRAKA
jgi:hypothetical protein